MLGIQEEDSGTIDDGVESDYEINSQKKKKLTESPVKETRVNEIAHPVTINSPLLKGK